MTEQNEAVETKEIRFNFTVIDMGDDQASALMLVIGSFLNAADLEWGGGKYPYEDKPDPRDAVVEAARKIRARMDEANIPVQVMHAHDELRTALDALEDSDVSEK